MMLLDVLSREAEELLIVRPFKPMTAGTVNRAHVYLPFLNAFTVVPCAPYFSALRRVSSKADRA
jgi:hypothetical protein